MPSRGSRAQRAGLALHEARDGRRNFEGVLLGLERRSAGVRTEDGQEHWFGWAEVRSARLVVDPWAGARKRPVPEMRDAGIEGTGRARARGGAG